MGLQPQVSRCTRSLQEPRIKLKHMKACETGVLTKEKMDKSQFSQKRVLVTGAGKGIGKALCRHLTGLGAVVIAVSRTKEDLDALMSEKIAAEIVQADLGTVEGCVSAAEKALPVDMLVNNAGIALLRPFLEASADDMDKTMNVNVRAVMLVSQVVAKDMIRRQVGGSIVNVSSQASMIALKDHTTYCASKGAVDQLTRVMALELGPHGIRVNACNPTVVMTAMGRLGWSDPAKAGPALQRISLGRFAEEQEVVDVITFLLSRQSSMVQGVALPIDGGFTSC